MEQITNTMINAAKDAGISMERAKKIYNMKVLGREHSEKIRLTTDESNWLVAVFEILNKDGEYLHSKDYHRFERRKYAKENINNAIWAIFGQSAIYESETDLEAFAKGINDLMVKIFDDTQLHIDDFAEIAKKIVKHAEFDSSECVRSGLEPPD